VNQYLSEAEKLFDYTQEKRRDFHRHPELGFQEERTSKIVAEELKSLGLDVTTGIAKTGVIAMLEGAHPGPVVLIRFDMDALPIQEENEVDYVSSNPGVMHACGHDGHTAIGLTVAKLLTANRDQIHGSVKFMFQPAEEGLGGAEQMVKEGVLENPSVDYALAMHLWNDKPVGWFGITSGSVMAASETFVIKLIGKGGHGAAPHLTIDPILAAANLITSVQGIVSRNVDPQDTAVVSVTVVRGGDTFNVIPSRVELQGTIRTFDPQTRKMVLDRFTKIVESTAESFGCEVDLDLKSITPAVINDVIICQKVQDLVTQVIPDLVLDMNDRTMGSEDMAFVLEKIPGCFIFVGSSNSEIGLDYSHHHPKFDFDEQALIYGTALMTAATLDLLK